MLSSFLATVTCLAIPVTEPLETPAVMSAGSGAVEVGIHVTPTSFRSRNFSNVTQHLLFAAEGSPEPVVVQMLPGAVVEYEFSPEALAGVRVEVVAKRDNRLTTSGAHSIGLPQGSPDMSLWIVPGKPRGTAWRQLGLEATNLPSDESLMPSGSTWEDPETDPLAATHVPVAVPRVQVGPGATNDHYSPM